jgi:hypothetical protein
VSSGKHPVPTVVRIEEFPNSPPAPLYLELRACGLAAIAGHGPNGPRSSVAILIRLSKSIHALIHNCRLRMSAASLQPQAIGTSPSVASPGPTVRARRW